MRNSCYSYAPTQRQACLKFNSSCVRLSLLLCTRAVKLQYRCLQQWLACDENSYFEWVNCGVFCLFVFLRAPSDYWNISETEIGKWMQVEIRSNVCHFVFLLELLVTSWAVWLTFFFFFSLVQALQSCHPSWAAQILLGFSWLLVMFHQYLQSAAAESMGCSRYWMVLVQRDPAERYKLRFVHRLPEMCCVCFSEADPVYWRLTFVAHFSRSAGAVWEAEPGSAAHCRVNPCAPWLLGMLHLASWKKDKRSPGSCFQSLIHDFIHLGICLLVHVLNLAWSSFPRSPLVSKMICGRSHVYFCVRGQGFPVPCLVQIPSCYTVPSVGVLCPHRSLAGHIWRWMRPL